MTIPKLIFQTFEHGDFHPDFQHIVDDWKIDNPSFLYKFYNKEEREFFIKNNFPIEVYNAYERIKPGAFKSDLWRYCILYKFGGFYIDIDTISLGELSRFINGEIDFVAAIDLNLDSLGHHNVANAFIGCIPNHPILQKCISRIVFAIENEVLPIDSIMDFTGPGCFGLSINHYLNRSEKESMINFQGVHNKIMLIKFEPNTEYVRDLDGKKILQNKNGNPQIQNLYNIECKKIENYFDWGMYGYKNVPFSKIVEVNHFTPSKEITTLLNYHNDQPANFYLYKYCGISDCIRRGYRWEEHQHDIIDKYLTPNSIAVEVGSHIGTITVKLSKVVKEVYAFEPFKSSYDLLEKNLKLNNCHNVQIFNKGISNTCSSTYIKWVSDNNPGGLGLEGGEITKKGNQNQKIKVELLTLDSLYLDKLDFLKIDVEGFETQVINGSQETIKKCMPLIIIEIFEDMVTGIKASDKTIMKRFGFLFEIGYICKHTYFEDFLFIPPNLTKK
jgi:FkbM family methyltransferase